MCKLVEDMLNENKKENAKKMLSDNLPVEKVAEYSGLSFDEVIALVEIQNKLFQAEKELEEGKGMDAELALKSLKEKYNL